MTKKYQTKCLIVGSGPAGYTAAIYAARANLKPILVAGLQAGGQLTITTDVENYPGFADTIQGPWLMEEMNKQTAKLNTEIIYDQISEIDLSKRPFKAKDDSGNEYEAQTVVISTGAQARWLGLDNEKKYQGYGVSGCATCDGFFFKDKEVMVVGGGNTAAEDALFLTHHAKKIYLVHRRDELRAEKMLQERMFKNKKIIPIWDSVLEDIKGEDKPKKVTGAVIKNIKTNKIKEMKIDGIFIAIGHTPNTSLFKDYLKMDNENYIITNPDSTKTSIEGVYAAGDVQDKIYRQAVTAAGTGCMAAIEVEKFLSEK
jgi:thioredoxin reductase (NADPH)